METSLIILAVLFVYVVYVDYRNYKERKDLITRIMARSLEDYVQGEATKERSKIPPFVMKKGVEL